MSGEVNSHYAPSYSYLRWNTQQFAVDQFANGLNCAILLLTVLIQSHTTMQCLSMNCSTKDIPPGLQSVMRHTVLLAMICTQAPPPSPGQPKESCCAIFHCEQSWKILWLCQMFLPSVDLPLTYNKYKAIIACFFFFFKEGFLKWKLVKT